MPAIACVGHITFPTKSHTSASIFFEHCSIAGIISLKVPQNVTKNASHHKTGFEATVQVRTLHHRRFCD